MYRFADPVTFGNYPESMRRIVGKRLPKFTEGESTLVKGSFDFLAINYYTTNYADAAPPPNAFQLSYTADRQVNLTSTYPSLSLPLLLLLALYIYIWTHAHHLFYSFVTAERDGVPVGSPVYRCLCILDPWHFFSQFTLK